MRVLRLAHTTYTLNDYCKSVLRSHTYITSFCCYLSVWVNSVYVCCALNSIHAAYSVQWIARVVIPVFAHMHVCVCVKQAHNFRVSLSLSFQSLCLDSHAFVLCVMWIWANEYMYVRVYEQSVWVCVLFKVAGMKGALEELCLLFVSLLVLFFLSLSLSYLYSVS